MNIQLVDSIIQMIGNLPPAERELVKQKLFASNSNNSSEDPDSLTIEDRKAFLNKPLAERQSILATQAEKIAKHYQNSTEWRELMAGDIIDD
jgi:hypothetical protein